MMNSRTNVVLAVFDSLGSNSLDQFAHSVPTLSSLKNNSVSFANAYVCSPESGPARASLFTGLDMAAHGVWTDGVSLPTREKTLPEVFSQCGYTSWLVGRRQLAGVSNWTTEHARPSEYQHINWAHGPLHRSRQNAYLAWLKTAMPEKYKQIFPCQPDPDDTRIPAWQYKIMTDLPDEYSFNTWVGKQYCQHLEEHVSNRPFLGVAGFVVGQSMGAQPRNNPCVETANEKALRQADAALASILDNLPDNTIVAITAGRGNLAEEQIPNYLHSDAIRVPLIMKTPDKQVKKIQAAVSTIDIPATLFKAVQIDSPKRMQGNCLLTMPARGWALSRLRSEFSQHQSAICSNRWKLVMSHSHTHGCSVVPGSYQLFDLKNDPQEANDLASTAAHAADLEHMIDQMIDARVALEDRTEPRIAKF